MDNNGRRYRRLVPACAQRDIGRTMAFELVQRADYSRNLQRSEREPTSLPEDSLDDLPAKLAAERNTKAA